MIVYIAAPYELKDLASRMMRVLELNRISVTSRWLIMNELFNSESAQRSLDDIARADTFMLINPVGWENKGTGGRHTEFGVALALGKRLMIRGVRSHIFHQLSSVQVIDDTEDFIKRLQS